MEKLEMNKRNLRTDGEGDVFDVEAKKSSKKNAKGERSKNKLVIQSCADITEDKKRKAFSATSKKYRIVTRSTYNKSLQKRKEKQNQREREPAKR